MQSSILNPQSSGKALSIARRMLFGLELYPNQIIFKIPILVEVETYLERVSYWDISDLAMMDCKPIRRCLKSITTKYKLYSLRAEIKQNLGTRGGGGRRIYIYIYIYPPNG